MEYMYIDTVNHDLRFTFIRQRRVTQDTPRRTHLEYRFDSTVD